MRAMHVPIRSNESDGMHPELDSVQTLYNRLKKFHCSSAGSSSDGSNDNMKWIIIGSVAGGVVLIALLILGFFLIRRWRKRKAYNMVHKGNDNAQTASGPGMSGGLMPVSQSQGPANG